jgi:hypothetical protein
MRGWCVVESPLRPRGGRGINKVVAIARVPGGIGRTCRVSRGLNRHAGGSASSDVLRPSAPIGVLLREPDGDVGLERAMVAHAQTPSRPAGLTIRIADSTTQSVYHSLFIHSDFKDDVHGLLDAIDLSLQF